MTAPEPDAAGAPAPTIREVFDRERERLAREWEAKHDSEAYLRAHTSVLDTAVLTMLAESGLPADRIGGRGRLRPRRALSLFRHRPSRPHGRVRQGGRVLSDGPRHLHDQTLGARSHGRRIGAQYL